MLNILKSLTNLSAQKNSRNGHERGLPLTEKDEPYFKYSWDGDLFLF